MNKKQMGDEGETFVSTCLKELGYIVEVHPRTFRLIFVEGKRIQISKDNDYHNLFDIKAERWDGMIYVQVKVEEEKSNVSSAQKLIDRDYSYEFPYQRIQTWQVWKEWVSVPRRHKEFKFRIQERRGFLDKFWSRPNIRKGNWVEIEVDELRIP